MGDYQLILDSSGLIELPAQFNSYIRFVSAYNNRLTAVPETVWELTSLRTLHLSVNRISSISPRIRALRELHTLDLGHNELTDIPEAIGELPNLSGYLYLSNNRLAANPLVS